LANEVCFRTIFLDFPWSIFSYTKAGGYSVWKKILAKKVSADEIINEIKLSALRGRGGAGFYTGIKWTFISSSTLCQKYVICNSDEGEPGTCKDREILLNNPHQIIEGMAIAAYVLGATIGYNYIRGEFYEAILRFETALHEARKNNLIGHNIMSSGIDFNLYCAIGAGAYICGEETALINSLEGRKGQPRYKPPFPATYGFYGCPTNINNTETYASVPVILEKGGLWFRKLGVRNSGGTKIFCISGHVNTPGIFEIGLGISFRKLLALVGGVKGSEVIKAVIPGGISCKILTKQEILDLPMDYDSLNSSGSMLGSGAIIIMNEHTSMVKLLARIVSFFYEESCGQCTPCREGTGWMARILNRLLNNTSTIEDLDNLLRIASNIEGNTICGLGDAASWPVQSYILKFRSEFETIINFQQEE
jgi:NADH-quinone oxidoreductase subunit F